MPIFLQDVRFALRQLWKHPGFALTAILSLALGIAATVSVFSVVYSVLINPSPYVHADRLAQFYEREKDGFEDAAVVSRSYLSDLRKMHAIEELVEMDEKYLAETTFDIPQGRRRRLSLRQCIPIFRCSRLSGPNLPALRCA